MSRIKNSIMFAAMVQMVVGVIAMMVANGFIYFLRSKNSDLESRIKAERLMVDGWTEFAFHYRDKWHKAAPGNPEVKEDMRSVLSVHEGVPQWTRTATPPAWLFGEAVADLESAKEEGQ